MGFPFIWIVNMHIVGYKYIYIHVYFHHIYLDQSCHLFHQCGYNNFINHPPVFTIFLKFVWLPFPVIGGLWQCIYPQILCVYLYIRYISYIYISHIIQWNIRGLNRSFPVMGGLWHGVAHIKHHSSSINNPWIIH